MASKPIRPAPLGVSERAAELIADRHILTPDLSGALDNLASSVDIAATSLRKEGHHEMKSDQAFIEALTALQQVADTLNDPESQDPVEQEDLDGPDVELDLGSVPVPDYDLPDIVIPQHDDLQVSDGLGSESRDRDPGGPVTPRPEL